MQKFSLLHLVTVGVVSSTLEELSMMDTPFTVLYHDPILHVRTVLSAMSILQLCHGAETWCVQEAICAAMQTISAGISVSCMQTLSHK